MLPPIDITARGFSLTNAIALAEASRLAYELTPTVFSASNHILIIETEVANVVAFRGTASIVDFVTDAKCWFGNDATRFSGRLHAGFDAAFASTILNLSSALAKLDPHKPIFFTGHSLGGAQADLAGEFFAGGKLFLDGATHTVPALAQLQVYTFGQPRVGNRDYVNQCRTILAGRHFRVVNQEDIVPRVPGLLAGYRDDGELHFMPSVGGIITAPALWILGLSDIWGLWREYRAGRIALLADHAIKEYQTGLQAI